MIISLVMMLPVLAFGGWLYLRFTPGGWDARSLLFDGATLLIASAAAWISARLLLANTSPDAGPIWRPVLLTLAVYMAFAIVVPIAAWIKRRTWQGETGAPASKDHS